MPSRPAGRPPNSDALLDGARGEAITIANEFAEVRVVRVDTRNGSRLLIESPKSGQWVALDPLELEALTWQNTATFSAMIGNPFGPLIPEEQPASGRSAVLEGGEQPARHLPEGGSQCELEGRRALVVGAGSGIGRAVVDAFVAEGARVAVLEREPQKSAALSAHCPTCRSP